MFFTKLFEQNNRGLTDFDQLFKELALVQSGGNF